MSALPPLLPYLTVSDGAAAIAFYKKEFGAVEHDVHLAPGSTKIMNACLSINGGVFMLSDDFSAQFGGASSTPEALGGSPVRCIFRWRMWMGPGRRRLRLARL